MDIGSVGKIRNIRKIKEYRGNWEYREQAGQRWKKGWSTEALLPEGKGQDHSWQKDSSQVYRTCLDFYCTFAVGPVKNRFFVHDKVLQWKCQSEEISSAKYIFKRKPAF